MLPSGFWHRYTAPLISDGGRLLSCAMLTVGTVNPPIAKNKPIAHPKLVPRTERISIPR
ncbi:hypothetical protein GCM10010981_07580 [Dyella nitratireducens]|uniref:Uncharacterized protein n=1 Tax=Dyella nitratireducens TaxID=1849580 RepID=A0ABQ1FLW8_9GAMM|nr:hypothetical protein GCM10010981_07580 [Dyella nitratireducens]GLQ44181.1 hypothetical protein GCM10007902_40310 [Dyella nitratireducens]